MTTDVGSLGKMALWEYGRRQLGFGDWSPETHPESYKEWCAKQAGALAMVMKRRRITAKEFALAVDYCAASHKQITSAQGVFRYLAEAKDWAASLKRAQHASDLAKEIAEAIACERASAQPDEMWIGRLARAVGPFRTEVLAEWRSWRADQEED